MPCGFRFRAIKQSARNMFSAKFRQHIEVLNFRNVAISKSGVSRLPVHRHVAGKLAVKGGDKTRAVSGLLLLQISPVAAFRLVPPHLEERGSDARWIAVVEKPNVNRVRVCHM